MDPVYHPRLKDQEVEYVITLRHTHERIKSGILVMAGATTLYLKKAMNEDAYTHLLRKAEEAYQEAARELGELEPPASLTRLHDHYLEGFKDYKAALSQLATLAGNAQKRKDRQWLVAVANLMSEGTRKIKQATLNFWLDEYITEHGEELEHQAEDIDEQIHFVEAERREERRESLKTHEPHQPGEVEHHHG